MTNTTTQTIKKPHPDFELFQVLKLEGVEKAKYERVGLVYKNDKGDGFNVLWFGNPIYTKYLSMHPPRY
ncbi:hypothetical protein Pse7367_3791 (plasmid) [Thalassoporum mexicanum PCC 7367]|uniref:hypothetical protein n=1 Tax=Thalassoporum mexicanum TaxID=3457544 RepID=UPI00029FD5C2|nr:hypothetical protein [Pseudanabaena sp. PCC 7367]AFY72015.1 hypothetical protein Pse7367_3791 [Pseudanabaena sp. PCC 7367]